MVKNPASSSAPAICPRRSALYMPASNERALAKARTLDCDVVIFDLEDAVAPDTKEVARETLAQALAEADYGHRELVLRVNGRDTPWFADDLALAARLSLDAVLLPKVGSPDDVHALAESMAAMGVAKTVALWAMIETPAAILALGDIAGSASDTGLSAFVVGTNDLAKDMRLQADAERTAFQMALSTTVMAARAHGLVALDGVFNGIGDADGLVREAEQGRRLGFDGKTVIHPSQIEACNQVFAPDPDALTEAHAIIAAFAEPDNADKGVISLNGKMVERLHLAEAERLVAEAEAIATR
ncbi:HpcH/HpaI aldolase/citrate lyase family protein [Alterisphingorhabdus coralli]|uniref:CoA ester lyase n=1 Tax=Alterisphingorhabdus coralli TaxID=3071408 RepID=A0AA97F7N0_9SPHN|nr:CoA ester lyase [Parasphingorhabdus sp. SCSIO 66989]WOE75478.1 CoA ester lyase [Parasphingorhabdus sp. SCSIO 66989]